MSDYELFAKAVLSVTGTDLKSSTSNLEQLINIWWSEKFNIFSYGLNHIKALEAKNVELEKQIEHFKLISADHSRALDDASELEKKLKIAVEALELFADPEHSFHVAHSKEVEGVMVHTMKTIIEKSKTASEALAAIKGEGV